MKGEGFQCPLGASHLCSLSFHASGSDTFAVAKETGWLSSLCLLQAHLHFFKANSGDVRQEIQGWMNGWMDGSWGGMALNFSSSFQ
jgi:hypothetical protein